MKLLVLIILSVGLFGCDYECGSTEEINSDKKNYELKLSRLSYLVRSVDQLREGFLEANVKCLKLGECYKKESVIFKQDLVLEKVTNEIGYSYNRVETPFKVDCQVGENHFEFDELDAAIRSCQIANRICDETKCERVVR